MHDLPAGIVTLERTGAEEHDEVPLGDRGIGFYDAGDGRQDRRVNAFALEEIGKAAVVGAATVREQRKTGLELGYDGDLVAVLHILAHARQRNGGVNAQLRQFAGWADSGELENLLSSRGKRAIAPRECRRKTRSI